MREKCCRNCKHFTDGRCVISDSLFNLEEGITFYGEEYETFERNLLIDINTALNINSEELDKVKEILETWLYDVTIEGKIFENGLQVNDYTKMCCSYYE